MHLRKRTQIGEGSINREKLSSECNKTEGEKFVAGECIQQGPDSDDLKIFKN
jgi:hypothetical protein